MWKVISIQDMLNDSNVDPQKIIEEFGSDCPSYYGLTDNDDFCDPSGDYCNKCWLDEIDRYREDKNGK